MQIHHISDSDKNRVLDFCKNTFSWGDYIELVWDHWMSERNFLGVYDGATPLGICHVSVSAPAKQIWIEGIRIRPEFRRQHLASELISKCEQIGLDNNCIFSFMLIEDSNLNSLGLAKKLGYAIESTWVFYSVDKSSAISDSNVKILSEPEDFLHRLSKLRFVDSWRWYPFDEHFVPELVQNGHVICSDFGSISTIIPSRHFDSTCMITVLQAGRSGMDQIIRFAQNYALQNKISRLQLLANEDVEFSHDNIHRRLVFHLLKKRL